MCIRDRHMRGEALAVHVRCDEYTGSMADALMPDGARWAWLGKGTGPRLGMLDASAAIDTDEQGIKWVTVAVVNAYTDKDKETKLHVPHDALFGKSQEKKKQVQVLTVTGSDAKVTNCDGKEEVGIKETSWEWDGEGMFTFPRLSLTMLRWKM